MTAESDASKKDASGVRALVAIVALLLIGVLLLSLRGGNDAEQQGAQRPPEGDANLAPKVVFTDITRSAGISFVHRSGAEGQKLLPESGGSGCAFLDYDGDGDPDLLLVNGRFWPWSENAADQPADTLALYRNDGGKFTDVTAEAGLRAEYLGQGVAVGDYDADGDDDLLITSLGTNHMYRNDGGTFTEVTAEVGLAGDPRQWTTSTGFFDYDRDGDLDLFVCNYVRWSREIDEAATVRVSTKFHSYATPKAFEGTQNFLFRNDGGRFTDVSAEVGIDVTDDATGQPAGKSLAVTFTDFDGDGWLDVIVANDEVRHFLFRNRGDGTFEEVGESRGLALNAMGAATSGMGVDTAWIYNNHALAVAIGNFADEMDELFITQSDDSGDTVFFADEALATGIGGPTRMPLTFGLLFDDFDLDGRVDLVQTNGHLEQEISQDDPNQQYAQPGQVFWNTGGVGPQSFVELPPENIGDLAKPIVGRGIASADIDGDGDLDLLLTQVNGPPMLLRNDSAGENHWLRFRLNGPAGNPHAIGAVVEVVAGGVTQRRRVMPTRGYLSQSEPSVTFGLGENTAVDSVTVAWPDGSRQQVEPEGVDRVVTVRQETQAESFAALANKAKAEMENGRFEEAITLLQAALAQRPDSDPVRRNLARAYVLAGRPVEARAELDRLEQSATEPSTANAYLLGLAALRQLDYEQALAHFTRAVELDPNEATLHFQRALALTSLGRTAEARQDFEKAAELDPLHGGAQYQLAIIVRKEGDMQRFRELIRDWERIRALKGTASAAALEQCRYTEPEDVASPEYGGAQPPEPPSRFVTVPLAAEAPQQLRELAAAAVYSLEENGRYQLVAVTRDGKLLLLAMDEHGQPQLVAESNDAIGPLTVPVTLCVARAVSDQTAMDPQEQPEGDWPELAIVTPERSWLMRYRPDGGFADLSESSGLSAATGTRARWIDLDHDGDVDLCTCTPSEGLAVWRNNSDGTFVAATAEFGIDGLGPCEDFAAIDFEGTNLGVDLVLAGAEGCALARNQLAGKFAADQQTSANLPAVERLLADDFNNDGVADLLFLMPTSATLVITGRHGRLDVASSDGRQQLDLPLRQIGTATTIDVDNDGWLDVAASGADESTARLIVLRNVGGRFADAPESLPDDAPALPSAALDLDADGDCDTDLLLISRSGELVLMRNDTDTTNRQVKLVLRSFAGHPSSIGVRVQLRREGALISRWTNRELPIEIGVGQRTRADTLQTLWMNGVAKNEIDVSTDCQTVRVNIAEFVRTSSCPFLYAWIGGQWQFVTDLLDTAPLNVAVARGVPMPPDPDELFVLGPVEQLAGDGTVRLRITSELREAIYLNHAGLLAVDHPEGSRVLSRDRVALVGVEGPQFALGRNPVAPLSAMGSDGTDRTAALAAEDGVMAEPGRLLPPPIVGFTEPLALELDFGPLDAETDYLLALTGWFRFGSSSTNIAASQRANMPVIWPRLEALDADGQWQLVDDAVGFPASNVKTIVCDLAGKLPAGARRLRLTTSFEVRWDHIALYQSRPTEPLPVTEITLGNAQLGWHGFAELRPTSSDQPQVPNLARMSDRPPWQTAVEGWCTRYGNVTPLLTAVDDRLAIMNSGDAVTLEFNADSMPPRPPGTLRTLLLYTRGWIKEEDPNSLADRRVSPLPDQEFAPAGEGDDWQREYNTRWVPRHRFRDPDAP